MAIATLTMLREPEIKMKRDTNRQSTPMTPTTFAGGSQDNSYSESTESCIDMSKFDKVKYLTGKVTKLV